MDYDWYYFVESMKTEYQFNVSALNTIYDKRTGIAALPAEQVKTMKSGLTNSFGAYRNTSAIRKDALNNLLKLHTEICQERPWDMLLKRRHNVLVYKYVVNTIAGNKVIAEKLGITKEVLFYHLDKVLREMMLLSVGMPYLVYATAGKFSINNILEAYHFLIRCDVAADTYILYPCNLQENIRQYQEQTSLFLKHLKRSLSLYGQFCSNSINPVDKRRFCILRMVHLKGSSTVKEMAEEHHCSQETIYNDIRENEKRLSQLLSMIIEYKGAPTVR